MYVSLFPCLLLTNYTNILKTEMNKYKKKSTVKTQSYFQIKANYYRWKTINRLCCLGAVLKQRPFTVSDGHLNIIYLQRDS